MSTTSKSPRKVALVALGIGKEALPAYCHRFSPKVFTQPHLFACLVLKEFFKTDYRGIMGILGESWGQPLNYKRRARGKRVFRGMAILAMSPTGVSPVE